VLSPSLNVYALNLEKAFEAIRGFDLTSMRKKHFPHNGLMYQSVSGAPNKTSPFFDIHRKEGGRGDELSTSIGDHSNMGRASH
jgi:hypothetical protein